MPLLFTMDLPFEVVLNLLMAIYKLSYNSVEAELRSLWQFINCHVTLLKPNYVVYGII